jgi:hypothetical protein
MIGTTLSHFKIIATLGIGGDGAACRAQDSERLQWRPLEVGDP